MRKAARLLRLFGALPLLLAATACVELVDSAQPRATTPVGEITGATSVGQSFVARHDNLSRVDILLATYARRNRQPLDFQLGERPQGTVERSAGASADQIADNRYQAFSFDPITRSAGREFAFTLSSPSSTPGDAVTAWHTPQDAYEGGSMLREGRPAPGDLAFRTYYRLDALEIATSLLGGAKDNLAIVLAILALLLLPGNALLLLARQRADCALSHVLLAAGVSAAALPVLLLFATLAGARFGPLSAWATLALAALGAAAYLLLRRRRRADRPPAPQTGFWAKALDLPLLLLVFAAVVIVASRFTAIRDLNVPMWGDSFHHAYIAQLMAEQGKVPDSFEPLFAIDSFSYHFGFHTLAAFTTWLTGLEATKAVLIWGQTLNVLAVLMLYPLALRLSGSRYVGLCAVLIAGLLSPMPAYYVNWGRYTQLAGQVILPAAMTLLVSHLEEERWSWRRSALIALSAAGLFLTHYRVAIFFAVFAVLYALALSLRGRGARGQPWARLGPVALGSLLLSGYWGWRLVSTTIASSTVQPAIAQAEASAWAAQYQGLGDVWFFAPPYLVVLAALGLVAALLLRQRGLLACAAWGVALMGLANLYLLGLPRAGYINNFSVAVALYLPLALLGGFFAGTVAEVAIRRWQPLRHAFAAVVVAGSLLVFANTTGVLDLQYQLVTPADERAITWVKENTPATARFVVNSTPAEGGRATVGTDAGWWLPVLTRRGTSVPPILYVDELSRQPGYIQHVNELNLRALKDLSEGNDLSWLREAGYTHVFTGERGGALDVGDLERHPQLEPLYSSGPVAVFRIRPTPAQEAE